MKDHQLNITVCTGIVTHPATESCDHNNHEWSWCILWWLRVQRKQNIGPVTDQTCSDRIMYLMKTRKSRQTNINISKYLKNLCTQIWNGFLHHS